MVLFLVGSIHHDCETKDTTHALDPNPGKPEELLFKRKSDSMSDIHAEMRSWRAHLARCREDREKHYIGNSKEE
tara:strand:+ start:210 stop:431 length:222 start_codon:yes stop_codon:yes gene_type:complete